MKYKFKPSHVVPAFLFVVAVLYGGSKPPMPTNTPMMMVVGRGLRSAPEMESTNSTPAVRGLTALPVLSSLPPPELTTNNQQLTTLQSWTARGAYCDWARIAFPDGFAFPAGTNLIDGVTLFAWGEVGRVAPRPPETESTNSTPAAMGLAALPVRVSLEPNASSVTHGLTPSNSYLFAWHNCCIERSATNRVNASIELFRSGEVVTTFNGVVGRVAPRPPEGWSGNGQDEDWVRATFPGEADNILMLGYESWLDDEWVGVNEQNGRYLAQVTINQQPSTNHQSPIYLVCGPYRVNVTAPGTYSFPLEVFETYEVRTYPTAVPFTIDFSDGYTGGGSSYEIVNADEEEERPRRMVGRAAPRPPEQGFVDSISGAERSPRPTTRDTSQLAPVLALPSEELTFYRFYMTPNVIVTPARIPLSTANGSTVSIWCKIADAAQKTYEAVSQELYLAFFASEAEIHDAFIAERVEIIMQLDRRECRGAFEIYDDDDDDEDDEEEEELPEREDESIFSGEPLHSDVSNDCVNVYLTGVSARDSTMANSAATAYGLAEGQSADVYVYMATSESGDDQYDDAVGWTVMANGTVGLQGESSVSEHANAAGGSTYGVTSGAVLLASGHFSPPSDDILRLRLQCWARNVGDGKKETCIQIVVVPRE